MFYGTEVTETFTSPDNWTPGTTTPKTVVVKNTGDVDVAVRVKYTEAWESANGGTLSGTQGANQAATINFANATDWTKSGDYYYYKSKLSKNQSTSSFISSVTFNSNITSDTNCTTSGNVTTCATTGDGYDGATYTLTITAETIQYDAYTTAWTSAVTIN